MNTRFAVFLFAAAIGITAQARDWYVAPDGSDTGTEGTKYQPYRTITNAVESASEGDVIFVKSGTYVENLSVTNRNNLTILGGYGGDEWERDLKNAQTVVKAADATKPVVRVLGETSGLRLGGLVLFGGSYGILTDHMKDHVFEQLVISNNTLQAINFCDTSFDRNYRMVIASCLIARNNGGLREEHCGWAAPWYIDILSCTFLDTGTEFSVCYGKINFRNNVFTRASGAPTVGNNTGNMSAYYYNNCIANGEAVETQYPESVKVATNNIYEAAGVNADGTLSDSSPCLKVGDDLSTNETYAVTNDLYGTSWDGEYDMGAIKSDYEPYVPRDLHVATDGSDSTGDGTAANPYATISKAVSDYKTGDRILVQGGLYSDNVVNTSIDDMTILGSFDRDWKRDLKNARTVIKAADATKPVLSVEGVWRNHVGGIDLTGGTYGLYLHDMRNHVFEQMAITNNTSAGIDLLDKSDDPHEMTPVFANLLVADNRGNAVRVNNNNWTGPIVWWYNCTFVDNDSYAVAQNLSQTFRNCICYNPKAKYEFTGSYLYLNIGACCVRDGLYGGCAPTVLTEPETITVDPLLDASYRPTADSYCNKGGIDLSDLAYSVSTNDIEGAAWGSAHDMGCYASTYPYVPRAARLKDSYVAEDGDDENGDGSAESPFATLAKALDRTDEGGTCHVGPGHFQGGVTMARAGMTLVGAGRDLTTVTNGSVTIGAHDGTVHGLSFRKCGIGIKVEGSGLATNAVIYDCICSGCTYGIYADQGSGNNMKPLTIHHVVCTNNTSRGVYCRGDLLVYDSNFSDNGNGSSSGIGVENYEGAWRVYNCTIADNPECAYKANNVWGRYGHSVMVNTILSGAAVAFDVPSQGRLIGDFSNCLFNCTTDFKNPIYWETNCLHNVDPNFKMKLRAPYVLAVGSQGRMAGADLSCIEDVAPGIVRDVDGYSRNSRWDMGCYRNVSAGLSLVVR